MIKPSNSHAVMPLPPSAEQGFSPLDEELALPAAPEGATRQLLSADGAMVPLVHGEWVEVKTVAIGEIQPPVPENGELVVHTTNLGYFSRLSEAGPVPSL